MTRPDNEKEIRALEAVVEREPENAEALHNLGVLHDQRRDFAGAENYYRKAIAADSGIIVTRRNLASLLFDQGRHDESRDLYRSLIETNPADSDAHYAYGKLTRYEESDPVLIALQHLSENIRKLPADEQIKACFTVAKANHDLGRFDDAFAAFKIGNDLHYRLFPYNEAANFAMLDDVMRCFDKGFFATQEPLAIADNTPIFVLGMPRSGSTLIEQILSSHSDVSGAGEVKYLKQSIQDHLIRDKGTFSNALPSWTREPLAAAANEYLGRLQSHANGRVRVVDKMPGNFAFIGLIHLMIPNASIIHTSRQPMATIWSNYSTLFGDALHYTYRLDVLTRYFEKYRDMMTHWKSTLPKGTFYTLKYERVVNDPENTLRDLFDYLGLSWEPGCLDFHATPREIKTASTVQVRQPLYTSALDAWQNYSDQLAPVAAQLNKA